MNDSLALSDVKAYYREKLVGDDDYDSLDQGEYMTNIRHEFVLSQLQNSVRVMDFGCGTGLLLTKVLPESIDSYYGADCMIERKKKFMSRLRTTTLGGGFYVATNPGPMAMFEYADALEADTVILCGVMGYQGFTDWKELVGARERSSVRSLIVTIPVHTPEYQESVIVRFDPACLTGCRVLKSLSPGVYGAVL